MINLYIDALAREGHWDAIDRIIQAQRWCTGVVLNSDGEGCLLGQAGGFAGRRHERQHVANLVAYELGAAMGLNRAENRFDKLVKRFGMDRVVRAIKQRCGKHTRPNVEQPASLTDSAVQKQVAHA